MRYQKYFIFSIVFLIGLGYIFVLPKEKLRSIKSEYVGCYKLDTANSIMKDYDKGLYQHVVLTIRKDNTFSFTETTPFLFFQNGIWFLEFFDTNECLYLKHNDSTKSGEQFCQKGNSEFGISYQIPIEGNKQVEYLSFVKITDCTNVSKEN